MSRSPLECNLFVTSQLATTLLHYPFTRATATHDDDSLHRRLQEMLNAAWSSVVSIGAVVVLDE